MHTKIATFTGPSGAGKSSYCREVLKRKPAWKLIPSITTRAPREKDLPNEYQYVTPEEFDRLDARKAFLWTVGTHGHRYGTLFGSLGTTVRLDRHLSMSDVDEALDSLGDLRLMLIEPVSVGRLREYMEEIGCRSLMHFYFCAPAEAELRRRLERRKARGDQVTDEEIELRIAECKTWDSEAYASGIPYVFLPGDVSLAEGAERVINVLKHLGGRS